MTYCTVSVVLATILLEEIVLRKNVLVAVLRIRLVCLRTWKLILALINRHKGKPTVNLSEHTLKSSFCILVHVDYR